MTAFILMCDCFRFIGMVLLHFIFEVIVLVIFAYNDHFSLVGRDLAPVPFSCPFLEGGVTS